jgi:putative hydrolase
MPPMTDGPLPDDPFGAMPFFGELMRMMQGAGPGGADAARQLARSIANDGQTEANINPTDRIAVEQLVRVAELHVAQVTDLPVARGGALQVDVGNRSQWADRTVGDYKNLFAALSESMAAGASAPDDISSGDPMASMLEGLSKMIGPMMLSMTTGSMVGNIAQRALGGYELPVPRPADQPLLILLRNVDAFGNDWSLNRDDLRLWVCLHEVAHHAVLGVPHVRRQLDNLLIRHARAFETNPEAIQQQLGSVDLSGGPDGLAELQSMMSDPEALLGAVRSPAQEAIQPELTALIAAITGYVDHVMDTIGATLIGSYDMLAEALRRRRVEANTNDRFVERILGLELDAAQYDRGATFATGVVERAGKEGLSRLWSDPSHIPTTAEVDAPGLWLARIDLPSGR